MAWGRQSRIRTWKRHPFCVRVSIKNTNEVILMNWSLPPVLVVDDEKNMRLSLKSILSGEGYELKLVESAEEAIALLEKETFFMVITDARLGGMSGYQFLATASKRWPNTPCLMITAYATPKLAVEAIKGGRSHRLSGQAFCARGTPARRGPLRGASSAPERKRRLARPCHRALPAGRDHWRIAAHGGNARAHFENSARPMRPF